MKIIFVYWHWAYMVFSFIHIPVLLRGKNSCTQSVKQINIHFAIDKERKTRKGFSIAKKKNTEKKEKRRRNKSNTDYFFLLSSVNIQSCGSSEIRSELDTNRIVKTGCLGFILGIGERCWGTHTHTNRNY